MPLHALIRPLRRLRGSVVAAACATLLGTAGSLPAAHAADRHPLVGSRPAYATRTADTGPVPAGSHVSARLYLNSRDPQGLAALLRDISDPRSPHYRHYLTPAEYQRHFGPTDRQIRTLTAWLGGSGFTVTGRTSHYLGIEGPARAVRQAFGTSLHGYRTGRGTSDAPAGDLSVPASLGATVLGVSGLSTPAAAHPLSTPAPALDVPADDAVCSGHFGEKPATGLPKAYGRTATYAPCPYTPAQLRHAYGTGAKGATGRGSTIAVVDAYGSPDMLTDADRYARATGDHAFRPGQYRRHVTPGDWHIDDACASPRTWAGEQALDIDLAHGLAPDANVLYVGANSCLDNDLMDAESYIIDGRRADVISNSWAEIIHSSPGHLTPTLIAAWNLLFEQAAAEGIGVYFAAGDCGDSSPEATQTGVNCDPKTTRAQADFPSGSPWVTSVGGTTLALDRHATTPGRPAWVTGCPFSPTKARRGGPSPVSSPSAAEGVRATSRSPGTSAAASPAAPHTARRPTWRSKATGHCPSSSDSRTPGPTTWSDSAARPRPRPPSPPCRPTRNKPPDTGSASPTRSCTPLPGPAPTSSTTSPTGPRTPARNLSPWYATRAPPSTRPRAHSAISSTPSATTLDSRPAAATTTPPVSAPPTPATCAGSSTPRAR
ncbi:MULTISPECIES: protease pro-enzyme activation domain-containing protein [unclassified Streptomyces]|uniref:S53 family peptidase n=1 Tax=unclassified Streptomyces TaxID=2593676 RepID=UPI0013DC4A7F|nr:MULTISPECIES: protease pro-enzyme activation domain-containing protein [unclassified Streptomyces]NMI59932.1 serine protease [Streptomyces sp. RLA2-12]